MRVIIFIVFILVLQSCDKNKELIRYSEYYHIEGIDTISAIYVPNTFTPDGDGVNDVFNIPIVNISEENEVKIFNSNGILMFDSKLHNGYGWDGTYKSTSAQNGQYTFKITAKDFTDYEYNIRGVVNLHR